MNDTRAIEGSEVASKGDAPVSLGQRFFHIRTFISFGVAFAVLYFVFKQMNLNVAEIVDDIRSANPFYFILAMVVYYSTFIVRSLRWRLLLENVGLDEESGRKLPSMLGMAEIIFLSWFANCIMPAKLGDAYRAYLLKKNAEVSFSKTFGTILAERIVDLLLTFVLLGITGLVAFRGSMPPTILMGMQASLVLVAAVVVGLLAMRNFGALITRLLPKKLQHYYTLFEEGTLHSFRQLPLVMGYSFLAWMIEAGRLYFVMLAMGLGGVSFSVIVFTAIAGSLLTSLPGTPAGLGFVESVIIGVLLLAGNVGLITGVDQSMATSVAILDRTISYWSLVLFGLIAYILTKKK